MAVLRGMVLLIADKHSCDIIQMVMIDTKFLRRKSLKMIPFPCFRLTLVCLIFFVLRRNKLTKTLVESLRKFSYEWKY